MGRFSHEVIRIPILAAAGDPPLPADFYEATKHVAFMPDGVNEVVLLTQASNGNRSLQKLTLDDATGQITAKTEIHAANATAELTATPVTLKFDAKRAVMSCLIWIVVTVSTSTGKKWIRFF